VLPSDAKPAVAIKLAAIG